MSAAEVDQTLADAVRLETAAPWVKHPVAVDPRDYA
jgi:hypothetical protein